MGSYSPPPGAVTSISSDLQDALQRYTNRNPVSLSHHKAALNSLPGGNTRSLLHESPFPIHIVRGERHLLYSADEHTYIDMVGELTAGLFGHSHPLLLETLTSTARDVGLSLGATNVLEARYASLLCERFGLDRVRFTNSGTEANLHALAAARKFTGRRKVLVFTGGYHGGVLTFGAPVKHEESDEGAPHQDLDRGKPGGGKKKMKYGQAENNVDQDTFVLVEYNDCEGVVEAFREQGEAGFAAVLVEPMQGSAGFIPATREFLVTIQEECAKSGAVFILDEVMTSRLAPGGMQSTFHAGASNTTTTTSTAAAATAVSVIKPGLTTFGKYLGGGMPFGAFGGSADIMAVYDPRNPTSLFHSGTFQNNTLMLAMGYTALSQVYTPEVAVAHSAKGERLRAKLAGVMKGTKVSVTGVGSLMCLHFGEGWGRLREEVRSKEHGGEEDEELKTLFWLEMLERGFWVQRRGSVALILDMPDEVNELFVDAVKEFLAKYSDYVRLEM